MSQCKWIYILLFGGFFVIGMPTAANCDEANPSSAKDCRVHIEKALEQYWDAKAPSERTNVIPEALSPSDEVEASKQAQPCEVDTEEDDDDDEEIEEGGETSSKAESTEGNDDDDDNDTDDDTEDDDDNDPDETPAEKSENGDEDDGDEDEDEEGDNDDEKEPDDVQNDSTLGETDDKIEVEYKEETGSEKGDEKEVEKVEIRVEEESDDQDDDGNDENDGEDEDDDDEEDDVEEATNLVEEDLSKNVEEIKKETVNEDKKVEVDDQKVEVDDQKVEVDDNKVKELKDEVKSSETIVVSFEKETPESQIESSASVKEITQVVPEESIEEKTPTPATDSISDVEDDSEIENIYEEEESEKVEGSFRSREHIPLILDLEGKGPEWEQEETKLAQSVFKDIRKIETTSIRPMELLYKYADSTSRVLGDAELFNKPMLLFLGPWNSGKTSVINYILGIENSPQALKTGTGITDTDFTIITSGDRQRVISGTELAADWKYAGTQKFGQSFLDHFRSIHIKNPLLEKVILIDTPGILENRKNNDRGYPFSDVFQWFIDRADAIYVVLDPSKVDIGGELGSVVEQLTGRDARFILNKADTIRRSDLMRVVGQLFWNLSPLMSSTEAPLIYAVSLTSRPYLATAPAKFLADQEKNFFYDMKATLEKHVENKILYARKHAVRVRNHAKMVDCFLATYYRHKSIFSNKRNVAKQITENPHGYNIFDGYGGVKNISRFDLPSPQTYKEFFKVHPLYDFKPLASTCSYFRGCPMDKLDQAITKDIPELLAKYQKMKSEISGEVKR